MLPESINTTKNLIDEHYENQPDEFRPHIGASILGNECDRFLWLSFRWVYRKKIEGRLRRLFLRGHSEEAVIIEHLRNIGCEVDGRQSSLNFGCHVSGSIDAMIDSGVPEAPKTRHVLECKTHNDDSFKELNKVGLEKAKFQHYVQCQVYMFGTGVDRALYFAVNKNDDELYIERVKLDKELAKKYIERGQRIALMDSPPERLSDKPTFYKCKMCSMYDFCHQTKLTNQVNCRTCAFSTAKKESTFHCAKHDGSIPIEFQKNGCDGHVIHPLLTPWERKPAESEWEAVYIIDGVPVRNGEADAYIVSSKEIIENPSKAAEAIRNA